MNNLKKKIILAGLLAALALQPVQHPYCDSTATASPPSEEKCGWYCKNLKLDWNYIFHPDRINQCKPRRLND
jgi:hypothetical protein